MIKIEDKKRIVIKVGTSTITHSTGGLNIRRMECLVKVLSDLQNSGKEVLIVTSGAIGVGVGKLGLRERPVDMPSKQAVAAIGQCELMYLYDKMFSEYNHVVSQVLLTRDVVENAAIKCNVINTFSRLLDLRSIPIINENDTVSVDEIGVTTSFGENDTLSAIVAALVDADLLIILSDIDGLFDRDPKADSRAKLIPLVTDVDDKLLSVAGGKGSSLGTGGMLTKLHAAKLAMDAGIDMVILNGEDPNILYDLFEGKQVGTQFTQAENQTI